MLRKVFIKVLLIKLFSIVGGFLIVFIVFIMLRIVVIILRVGRLFVIVCIVWVGLVVL